MDRVGMINFDLRVLRPKGGSKVKTNHETKITFLLNGCTYDPCVSGPVFVRQSTPVLNCKTLITQVGKDLHDRHLEPLRDLCASIYMLLFSISPKIMVQLRPCCLATYMAWSA
jgi:hypothetical protein